MFKAQKIIVFILSTVFLISCKNEVKKPTVENENSISEEKIQVDYAKGFTIDVYDGYKTITLNNPWPGSNKTFTYALVEEKTKLPNNQQFDAIVQLPLKNIVVTSTTHIPSLEMLGVENALVGFPNLDYISSQTTRNLIVEGKITELGKNEDINTEILIELSPDAVIGFAVDGNNSTFSTIAKVGIPVLYNSDWTEVSPLGKAEWIKFFGVLFNKESKADSIFKEIEIQYLNTKKIADKATTKPNVLSGAMYKDIWYMPQGDSWMAQFIEDAHGNYLWKDSEGTGSLSLNLESVLDKGKNGEFWIGPGQFTTLSDLKSANPVYSQFDAFKNGNVFSYSLKKGETGGLLYYELAPNRPDLVLKDILKILHPELMQNHDFYFFSKLN